MLPTPHNSAYNINEANRQSRIDKDVEHLLAWAVFHNIDENILPHSKDKLLALEVLNLSNIPLKQVPKHIHVLQNLKKLYMVNCQLMDLPLEIYTLNNLEIIWLQNNHLTYISDEVNNLKKLQELVIYDNNIQNIPSLEALNELSTCIFHRNLLSDEVIQQVLKTLPDLCVYSSYDQREKLPFIIEALSFSTLKEAEELRDKVFKEDLVDIEKKLLLASLNPMKYQQVYKINDLLSVSYWIVKDKESGKVIGLTGMYTEDEDESCWLGWFCIDEDYRGGKFGKKLLEFSIEQAKKMEKKSLHVYTYKAERFERAIALYKKYDFKEYQEENNSDKNAICLQKSIVEK